MHLDAALLFVVDRTMPPPFNVEIAIEFLVDASEQIEIELRGHAEAVVVGAVQNRRVLFEIHTEKQPAPRSNHGSDA